MRVTVTAFPLYPDGKTGDTIAVVEADAPFVGDAMHQVLRRLGRELVAWWPGDGGPDAIDVTINWSETNPTRKETA